MECACEALSEGESGIALCGQCSAGLAVPDVVVDERVICGRFWEKEGKREVRLRHRGDSGVGGLGKWECGGGGDVMRGWG